MKIHKYNIKKYNFAEIIGNKFNYEDGYKVIRSNKFSKLWNSFVREKLTEILNSNKIVVQQLPSLKIHLSHMNNRYNEMQSGDGDGWGNMHSDGDAPYYHPKFEINFWMPMIEVDLMNTMKKLVAKRRGL